MTMRTDILDDGVLNAALQKIDIDICASVVKCASTQDYAKSADCGNKDHLYVAVSQSEGRGRLDRKFVSHEGGCYFTLVTALEEKPPLSFVPLISVATATVLAQYGLDAKIKWPNDIFLEGKKICGILSYTDSKKVYLGVGINVFNDLSELTDIATSLYLEGVRNKTRAEVIADVLKEFYKLCKAEFDEVMSAYRKYLNILGKKVVVARGKDSIEGIVTGISREGALLVDTSVGTVDIFSGDVTVTD